MLDNLVVSTALNVIRQELGATIEQLEWTVNAYTLTFAVFLLTGAALGDRRICRGKYPLGRRRGYGGGIRIDLPAGRLERWIGRAHVSPLGSEYRDSG